MTEAFQQTGTAHIIAISGFNISILAGLFVRGFGRFTRRWVAVVLALLSISFYTLLVGAQPSVVRAAIMGAVGLFGPLLGRRQVGANSLAFVAALMCLFDPTLPWDISFQLSFSGTLGLVLFADPLLNGLRACWRAGCPLRWRAELPRRWPNIFSSPWLPRPQPCRSSPITSSASRSAPCWPTPWCCPSSPW